jgi:hypothetical protein
MVYVPGVAALLLTGLTGNTVMASDDEVSGHVAEVDVVTVVSPVPLVVFVNVTTGLVLDPVDSSKNPEPVMVRGVAVAAGLSAMLETLMALSVGEVSTVTAFAAVSVPASSTIVNVAEPEVAVADVA